MGVDRVQKYCTLYYKHLCTINISYYSPLDLLAFQRLVEYLDKGQCPYSAYLTGDV